MVDFQPTFQTVLTGLGIIGLISVALVYFRSRYTQELIKSLQDSYEDHSNQIKVLRGKVDDLENENRVIKQLPLQKIATTQDQILELLKTQNDILTKMSLTPTVSVTNK